MCSSPLAAFTSCEIKPHLDNGLIEQLRKNDVRIIVMRHGQAVHNLKHTMNSSRSPGIHLTEKGIQQVKASAEKLKDQNIDIIYVSPVYRTLQTAQIVGAELNIPFQNIVIDDRLREQSWGTYEGRTWDEYKSYFKNPEDVFISATPGGESGSQLYGRMLDFLKSASRQPHKTILIVSHSFNAAQVSMILTGAFDDPEQGSFKIYEFPAPVAK